MGLEPTLSKPELESESSAYANSATTAHQYEKYYILCELPCQYCLLNYFNYFNIYFNILIFTNLFLTAESIYSAFNC